MKLLSYCLNKIALIIFSFLLLSPSQYSWGGIEEMLKVDIEGRNYIDVNKINGGGITCAVALEIKKLLLDPQFKIHRAYLRGTSFEKGALKIILETLKESITLKQITIYSKIFNLEDALEVGMALQYKSNLTTLHLELDVESFDESSIKAIADALSNNVTLKTFSIIVNHLKVAETLAIAVALRINKTLEDITISSGDIEGVNTIVLALIDNTTLLKADINCSEEQRIAIEIVLQRNVKMATLRQRLRQSNIRGGSSFLLGSHQRVGSVSPIQVLGSDLLPNIIGYMQINNNELDKLILSGTLEELRRHRDWTPEDIALINEARGLQMQLFEQMDLPTEGIKLLELEPMPQVITTTVFQHGSI